MEASDQKLLNSEAFPQHLVPMSSLGFAIDGYIYTTDLGCGISHVELILPAVESVLKVDKEFMLIPRKERKGARRCRYGNIFIKHGKFIL